MWSFPAIVQFFFIMIVSQVNVCSLLCLGTRYNQDDEKLIGLWVNILPKQVTPSAERNQPSLQEHEKDPG